MNQRLQQAVLASVLGITDAGKSFGPPDAAQWEAAGNEWQPDIHIICTSDEQLEDVQSLLNFYGGGIVARHFQPLSQPGGRGVFGIELQWGDSADDQRQMAAFRKEYNKQPKRLADARRKAAASLPKSDGKPQRKHSLYRYEGKLWWCIGKWDGHGNLCFRGIANQTLMDDYRAGKVIDLNPPVVIHKDVFRASAVCVGRMVMVDGEFVTIKRFSE